MINYVVYAYHKYKLNLKIIVKENEINLKCFLFVFPFEVISLGLKVSCDWIDNPVESLQVWDRQSR